MPAPAISARQAEQPPAQASTIPDITVGDRNGSPGGERAKPVGLPVAEVPWPETGGIEDEIVKALQVEARPGSPRADGQGASLPDATVRGSKDKPAHTLGDLAERLESAEMEAAHKKPDAPVRNVDAFAFEQEMQKGDDPAPAPQAASEPADQGGQASQPAAEPDGRPERQDEAPVISLNSRRREPIDPLEDEMARLLGELTGDSGRR